MSKSIKDGTRGEDPISFEVLGFAKAPSTMGVFGSSTKKTIQLQ